MGSRAVERVIYRICGVDADEDQHWTRYASAVLLFSAVSLLVTYVALRLQHLLPLNPAHRDAVPDRQAFETAASFTTNTNWQSYSGETTMSYFSQMTQLTFHNFASAAAGMGAAVALARGVSRRSAGRIGNFWVDLMRGTLYVFLPLSFVLALVFVQQGVIQNFHAYVTATTLEGAKQVLAMGPVASQEAIKQIGTNGGGFFNANSAHPFENPDTAHELPSDSRDLHHPRRARVRIRTDGEERTPWLGDLGRDVRDVLRRRDDGLLGGGARESDPRVAWCRHRRDRRESRRQHGREGGAIRHRELCPLRDHHDRRLVWLRQRHARLLHAASADSCRW